MRRKGLLIAVAVIVLLVAGAYVLVQVLLGSDFVRATVERQMSERLGQPVRIASASAAVFPRVALDLHDISIAGDNGIRVGEIRIVTGLRGLLSRRVRDAEVVVRDARLPLPLPLSPSGGEAAPGGGSPAPTAPPAAPPTTPSEEEADSGFSVESVRLIALRNVTLNADGADVVVDVDSSIEGDRLLVPRLSVRASNTRIEGQGELASMSRLEGKLSARADPLDLGELMAFAAAASGSVEEDGSAAGNAGGASMHLVMDLSAPSGSLTTYTFTDLSTTVDLTPGRVVLAPLSLRTFGGAFEGRMEAETAGTAPRVVLKGKLEGLDVPALMKAAGSPGGITGQLAGTVALRAAPTGSAALTDTADGTFDLAVTNGNIPGLDMVRTLVLAFGKPSGAPPEGSGTAFSRLGGRFALAGGMLSSQNITLASRDFDMAAKGSLQLTTGALNASAEVVLSKELTDQAGTDLRRYAQEDGRVVVPATIGGTLQSPRVVPDIAAATKRAIGNEMKRRVKTFVDDLFKRR